jgi:hypothetical protein
MKGYGYLLVTASSDRLKIDLWEVPSARLKPRDSVTVDLAKHRLV